MIPVQKESGLDLHAHFNCPFYVSLQQLSIFAAFNLLEVNTDVILKMTFPQAKIDDVKTHPGFFRLQQPPQKGKLNIILSLPVIH
jgi:hypothetical protein